MKKIVVVLMLSLIGFLSISCVTPYPGASRDPVDYWAHEFDGRSWELAYKAGNDRKSISEWLVKGDDIRDWEEIVTVSVEFVNLSTAAFAGAFVQLMKRNCPDVDIRTDKSSPEDIVIYWEHDGCGNFEPQKEIRRSQKGRDGLYSLSYAVKKRSYNKDIYDIWRDAILAAKLTPLGTETKQADLGNAERPSVANLLLQ